MTQYTSPVPPLREMNVIGASIKPERPPGIEAFGKGIELYIKPLIYGAEVQGPAVGNKDLQEPVVFDTLYRLLIAVPGSCRLHYALVRPIPFSSEEKNLVHSIVASVQAGSLHTSGAFHLLACNAVEQALSRQIYPEHPDTVYKVLQIYNQWAGETHEGRKLSHTIGICPGKQRKGKNHIASLKDVASVKSLGSDNDCMLVLCGGGTLLGVENPPAKANALRKNHAILAPVGMSDTALWTGSGGRAAIRLTQDGEILIFRNKMLVFAKRRSIWRCLPHKRLLDELLSEKRSKEEEETRMATYLTVLDLAFGRSGGCLGVLPEPVTPESLAALVSPDVLFSSENATANTQLLKELVNARKFYDLPRKLRKQLCSLDGAMLLDAHGTILTAGAIIKTGGNPDGRGGRSAAARTLGKNGVGFKVSNDGYVEMYLAEKPLPSFA